MNSLNGNLYDMCTCSILFQWINYVMAKRASLFAPAFQEQRDYSIELHSLLATARPMFKRLHVKKSFGFYLPGGARLA